MDRRLLSILDSYLSLPCRDIPHNLVYLIIFQLVKYAVRSYKKIVVLVHSILLIDHLWCANNYSLCTSKMCKFGFTVTKSTADRESTRENTIWSNKWVVFVIWIFGRGNSFLPDLLSLSSWKPIPHDCLCLVYITTCIDNSLELTSIGWFMISRHLDNLWRCLYFVFQKTIFVDITTLNCLLVDFILWRKLRYWRYGSWVSNIEQIKIVINNQNHDCARACLVMGLVWRRSH